MYFFSFVFREFIVSFLFEEVCFGFLEKVNGGEVRGKIVLRRVCEGLDLFDGRVRYRR